MEDSIMNSIDHQLGASDGIVSYKSLAVALGWTLETAQKNLEIYHTKHCNLNAVYCVSGFQTRNDGEMELVIRLTRDATQDANGLEQVAGSLYSLHKTQTMNPAALAAFDESVDHDIVAHKELVAFPWTPRAMQVSSSDNKQSENKEKTPTEAASVSKHPEPPTRTSHVAKRQSVKRPPKAKTQASLKFNKKSTPQAIEEKAKEDQIPDPFADSEGDEAEDDLLSASSDVAQAKRRRLVFSSSDEDVDYDHGKAKKAPKPTTKKKVKSPTSTKKSKHESPRKSNSSVDKEKPVTNDIDITESPTVPPTRPNQRRRQVTKTFMDEDGFLITEKVWEEVPVTEAAEEEQPPTTTTTTEKTTNRMSPAKPQTSKPKPSQQAQKPTKQATLMSFFKK